jgi:hypothetical protein
MGPEDIFGQPVDDSRKGGAAIGKQKNKPAPTPAPQSASPQRQSAASTKETPSQPQPSATSAQPATAPPSPTIAAPTLATGVQRSPLSQEDSSDKLGSKWAAPALITMALFVSGALIFTLTKLVEKIREGSSG